MISFEQGKDYTIDDPSQLPYKLLENIGFGHSGIVEKVQDVVTGKTYARKQMMIRSRSVRAQIENIFRNEVKIIRDLDDHHHMIQVFATYITKQHMGLILQPVASHSDLGKFLDYAEEHRTNGLLDPSHLQTIDRAFGCLASGLAFMHQRRVRHKDIKLQNILIHEGDVIYTDFGYSSDFSQLSRSTTEGLPNALTRRYAAPEVLKRENRNSSSDVFSLGCVYLELLATRENNPLFSPDGNFAEHIEHITLSFQRVEDDALAYITFAIQRMLSHKLDRLKATAVEQHFVCQGRFCCAKCRLSSLDSAKDKDVDRDDLLSESNGPALDWTIDSPYWNPGAQVYLGFVWSPDHRRYYRERRVEGTFAKYPPPSLSTPVTPPTMARSYGIQGRHIVPLSH